MANVDTRACLVTPAGHITCVGRKRVDPPDHTDISDASDAGRGQTVHNTYGMSDHPSTDTAADTTVTSTAAKQESRIGKVARATARIALGLALLFAGIGHLTALRAEFQAQVPTWLPLDTDLVVVASGVVEILLGAALLFAPRVARPIVGWIAAAFFVAIFPGNISQYVEGIDAFGLDSDQARLGRLFFQPVLVLWALWSTGAWRWLRARLSRSRQAG